MFISKSHSHWPRAHCCLHQSTWPNSKLNPCFHFLASTSWFWRTFPPIPTTDQIGTMACYWQRILWIHPCSIAKTWKSYRLALKLLSKSYSRQWTCPPILLFSWSIWAPLPLGKGKVGRVCYRGWSSQWLFFVGRQSASCWKPIAWIVRGEIAFSIYLREWKGC